MALIPKQALPDFMQIPELKGVFVGGCVLRGEGSSFRAKAHAHFSHSPGAGHICIRSSKRLGEKHLLLHELAHILTDHGHDDVFRKALKRLGGTLNYWETKEYHKLRREGIRVRSTKELKQAYQQIFTKKGVKQTMADTDARKAYRQSEKGKEARRRYQESEKGKAARARYMEKRKAQKAAKKAKSN